MITQTAFNPVEFRSTLKSLDKPQLDATLSEVNTKWLQLAPEQRTVGSKNIIIQNESWARTLSGHYGLPVEPVILAEITPTDNMNDINKAIEALTSNGFTATRILNSEANCKLILILTKAPATS